MQCEKNPMILFIYLLPWCKIFSTVFRVRGKRIWSWKVPTCLSVSLVDWLGGQSCVSPPPKQIYEQSQHWKRLTCCTWLKKKAINLIHFTAFCMRGVEGKRFWMRWVGTVCPCLPAEACWGSPLILLFVCLLTYRQHMSPLVVGIYSAVFCPWCLRNRERTSSMSQTAFGRCWRGVDKHEEPGPGPGQCAPSKHQGKAFRRQASIWSVLRWIPSSECTTA